MKLYSIEELSQRYEDKPSTATIYKYFKRQELAPFIVVEGSKKLTEEGVILLDQIREANKKYRVEVRPEHETPVQQTNQFKEASAPSEDYKIIIETLNEQLREKDKQISKLHELLEAHTKTIALQNGTLQLKEGKDLLQEQTEKTETVVINDRDTTNTKKTFWNWFLGR